MVFGSNNRWRWALPFAMWGAVGCSKVQLPSLSGITVQAPGTRAGVRGPEGKSEFDKACQDLPGVKDVLVHSIDQYPALIKFVQETSPLVKSRPVRLIKAHKTALTLTNNSVVEALRKAKDPRVNDAAAVAAYFQRRKPNPDTDLKRALKYFKLTDRTPCANAYLSHFYSNFIKTLDPMGEAVFGMTERKAPDDTLNAGAALPDELKTAPPVELIEGVLKVNLPTFLPSPALDAALKDLESGQKTSGYAVVLFDLRSVGGIDFRTLVQLEASAAKGWGSLPIVFWTDQATRGVAAVAVYQFAQRPNVLVIGADEETYGYGRKLAQRSTVLVEGLPPLTLTLGTEYIQPGGLPGLAEGYQLNVTKERSGSLTEDGLFVTQKEALERAKDWHAEAPVADPAPEPTEAPAAEASEDAQSQSAENIPAYQDPNAIQPEGQAGTIFGSPLDLGGQQQHQIAPDHSEPQATVF
jgi:hypothetical protein